jgi:hypothetical protein
MNGTMNGIGMIWLHCKAATEPRDYVKVSCFLGDIVGVEARGANRDMHLHYFVQLKCKELNGMNCVA